jgi:hypothetical protein
MYDSITYSLADIRKQIDKFEREVADLRKAAFGAPGPVKSITFVTLRWSFNPAPSAAFNTEALEKAWLMVQETHACNGPAIAHNTAIREAVAAMMKGCGIDATYTVVNEAKSGRSKTYSRVTAQAGWVKDLMRTCPIDDGFEQARIQYEQGKQRIAEYQAKEEKQATLLREAAREQEKERLRQAVRAVMIVKHGLDPQLDLADVLEAILTRDKYAALGYALERNCNDWSDGCYYADIALAEFKIAESVDQEIAAEIRGLIDDWDDDSDGRVFGGCTWNYNALYEMANAEIVKDLQAIRAYL